MQYLLTYDQLKILEQAALLLNQDLRSTNDRLVEMDGTPEQHDKVIKQISELSAAVYAVTKAFYAQFPGDPEKTGWVLKPVEEV